MRDLVTNFYQTEFPDVAARQGWINPGRQLASATKFCMVATNICGPSVWNLLLVTLLAPRILRRLLDFWNICTPLL